MSSRKFWKGILLGAIAGGAISLLDRETRQTVLANCQETGSKVAHYVKHPQEAVRCVKDSTRRIRTTIEDMSEEISFIAEKVEELREITPQVTDIIKDTKEVLLDDHSDEKTDML